MCVQTDISKWNSIVNEYADEYRSIIDWQYCFIESSKILSLLFTVQKNYHNRSLILKRNLIDNENIFKLFYTDMLEVVINDSGFNNAAYNHLINFECLHCCLLLNLIISFIILFRSCSDQVSEKIKLFLKKRKTKYEKYKSI